MRQLFSRIGIADFRATDHPEFTRFTCNRTDAIFRMRYADNGDLLVSCVKQTVGVWDYDVLVPCVPAEHRSQQMIEAAIKIITHIRLEYRHMTLGEMIAAFSDIPDSYQVELSNSMVAHTLHDPHSYRGIYEDLAFVPVPVSRVDGPVLARAFKLELMNTVDRSFGGYGGGDFTMGETTKVWISPEGIASQIRVVGVVVDHSNKKAVIVTAIGPSYPTKMELQEGPVLY